MCFSQSEFRARVAGSFKYFFTITHTQFGDLLGQVPHDATVTLKEIELVATSCLTSIRLFTSRLRAVSRYKTFFKLSFIRKLYDNLCTNKVLFAHFSSGLYFNDKLEYL
jgi:hypothetical protein